QCFACSGRSNEQDTFGDFGTKSGEATGIAEEVDNFLQILLGGFQAGNVIELCRFFIFFESSGRAANEATHHPAGSKRIGRATQHIPHEEDEEQWHQHPEEQVSEADIGNWAGIERYAVFAEFGLQFG
ncbi:MAG: hypothetical protein ACKPJJ_16305, partial [Planctomycetaceae bacterium]